jgi:hypothetical protein
MDQTGKTIGNAFFGGRVQSGGGLIEHQNLWTAEQGARNGDSLPLSGRKSKATLADQRVVAFRQGCDEIVNSGEWAAATICSVVASGWA